MKPKKTNRANLEKRKTVNLAVGLLVSLSLILISFEWTTPDTERSVMSLAPEISPENEIIQITRRDEVKPPKPDLPAYVEVMELVDDDIKLEDIDFNTEVTKDTRVDLTIYIDSAEEVIDGEVERYFVEIMPTFNGRDPKQAFSRYIASKMHYPDEAVANGVQGRVWVKFVINSKGELVNPEIYRSVHPDLDNEALRVIKTSPPWEPGIQSGVRVNVTYIFPINFVLH